MAAKITWTDSTVTTEGESVSLNINAYAIQFDADMRRVITSRADVTQFAVESGAALTDHKKSLPRQIILEGRVSNTPIGAPPPSGQSFVSRVSAEVGEGNVVVFSEEFDRTQDVYDSLFALVRSPIFVTLETPQEIFERLTVQAVEDIRNAPHYDGADFIVTFQEIFLADTQTVEIPIPREPRGQSKKKETANSTNEADRDNSPPQSWALGIGRSFGVFD